MSPRLVLLCPVLAVAALVAVPSQAHADPLLCVDIGAIDVGDVTVDPPEICVL